MKFEIDEQNLNKRFDAYLSQYLNISRTKASQAIEAEIFTINSLCPKSSYKLSLKDTIEYNEDKLNSFLNPDDTLKPYKFELNIVYQDEYLAVINKPKGILTHPTKYEREKTISNALLYHFKNLSDISGKQRPGIVHRLDKNTSGLMIIAKDNETHTNLAEQIKSKKLKRKYLAIALCNFEKKEGEINKPLVHYMKDDVKMMIAEDNQGLEAITKYKILEEFKGASLVELELKTGRTHQIRAHLSYIKHPIFGDSLYGAKSYMRNEFYNLKTQEQLLQSYFISFIHPKTKEKLEFKLEEKDFSKDFIKVLKFLRRTNNGNNEFSTED